MNFRNHLRILVQQSMGKSTGLSHTVIFEFETFSSGDGP